VIKGLSDFPDLERGYFPANQVTTLNPQTLIQAATYATTEYFLDRYKIWH